MWQRRRGRRAQHSWPSSAQCSAALSHTHKPRSVNRPHKSQSQARRARTRIFHDATTHTAKQQNTRMNSAHSLTTTPSLALHPDRPRLSRIIGAAQFLVTTPRRPAATEDSHRPQIRFCLWRNAWLMAPSKLRPKFHPRKEAHNLQGGQVIEPPPSPARRARVRPRQHARPASPSGVSLVVGVGRGSECKARRAPPGSRSRLLPASPSFPPPIPPHSGPESYRPPISWPREAHAYMSRPAI